MTTFLRVISCGLIDLHHPNSNHTEGSPNPSMRRAAEITLPRISSFSSSNPNNNATAPGSPRKNKRLSGQHIVSRLSRRRHRSKNRQSYDGYEGTDANGGGSKNVQGLVGATGEDFRIRDEDIAVSAYQPSCAASIASSMTRPHLSLTNTSSAFHEITGGSGLAPPPMPDLNAAMAASNASLSGKGAARPRSGLANVENTNDDELVATASMQLNGHGRVSGAGASPKSMSLTSNTTAATPLTSPRPSATIERTTNKPDHIHNHTLVVDTALDRHFGF